MKDEEFYEGMGKYFVQLATDAGYRNLLLALGRGIRDFFLNLDNLHDYLKFTFTKMKAPSFFVETESESMIMLQYRIVLVNFDKDACKTMSHNIWKRPLLHFTRSSPNSVKMMYLHQCQNCQTVVASHTERVSSSREWHQSTLECP